MKAISLWQPYPTLVMCGAKPYETRTRAAPAALIGHRIAIHAAGRKPSVAGDLLKSIEYCLKIHRRPAIAQLPRGCIIGTAVIAGAYRCGQQVIGRDGPMVEIVQTIPESAPIAGFIRIDDYGDYSAGRWAWRLVDIQEYPYPIPVRGRQGWWNWDPPGL